MIVQPVVEPMDRFAALVLVLEAGGHPLLLRDVAVIVAVHLREQSLRPLHTQARGVHLQLASRGVSFIHLGSNPSKM